MECAQAETAFTTSLYSMFSYLPHGKDSPVLSQALTIQHRLVLLAHQHQTQHQTQHIMRTSMNTVRQLKCAFHVLNTHTIIREALCS